MWFVCWMYHRESIKSVSLGLGIFPQIPPFCWIPFGSLCVFSFPRQPREHFISPWCQRRVVSDPVTALPLANRLISPCTSCSPSPAIAPLNLPPPLPRTTLTSCAFCFFCLPCLSHFFLPLTGAGSGLVPSARASCFFSSNSLDTSAIIVALSAFCALRARTFSPWQRRDTGVSNVHWFYSNKISAKDHNIFNYRGLKFGKTNVIFYFSFNIQIMYVSLNTF